MKKPICNFQPEYGNGNVENDQKPCSIFHKKPHLQQEMTQNATEIPAFRANKKNEKQTVYEKKYMRLNNIAKVMFDLRDHLSQHMEHIKVIQEKVAYLMKILNVFNMFHIKGAASKFGNIVRMKNGNIVKNVILYSSETFGRILSNNLKTIVLNLETLIKNRNRINKRSIIHTHEMKKQLEVLHVNKLKLISEISSNIKFKSLSIHRYSKTEHLNGRINLHRLVVKIVENNVKIKRTKRAISMSSLEHSSIKSKTINSVVLNDFLNGLFRIGKNTIINGLFEHMYIVFR